MLQNDNKSVEIQGSTRDVFFSSMISGAAAGLVCDMIFFPMDTVKTRLQSPNGFLKSGGFKALYKGLGPVIAGSAPTASLFFVTYEGVKHFVQPNVQPKHHTFVHMGAASVAEMVSCLIRVPVEVLKQRRQALLANSHPVALGIQTLYRGYSSTLLRDVPFGFLQMPLWEYLKLCWKRRMGRDCTPVEGAIAGALSVTVSAAVTTPLDVVKTRIMLAHASQKRVKIYSTMKEVFRERGIRGLFTGCTLRAVGFTVGGFVFFGIYEQSKYLCSAFIFPKPPLHKESHGTSN